MAKRALSRRGVGVFFFSYDRFGQKLIDICFLINRPVTQVSSKIANHPSLFETFPRLVQADPYLWPFDGQLTTQNTALLSINFQKNILDTDGDFAKSDIQELK